MNDQNGIDNNIDDELISKSQVKREFKAYQELGAQLMELPKKQLVGIPISDEMRDLIVQAQLMKRGTLNRQLRLIGSRMPGEDVDLIRSSLEILQQPHKKAVGELHEVEQWRDRLMQGDQAIFDELTTEFASLDRQYVNQLIRNAKKEQQGNKPPKSSRLLFKYLSELHDAK